MDDVISRKTVLDALGEPHPMDYNACSNVRLVKDIPSVDAAPVKHGKWEEPEPEGIISYNRGSYAQCSVCKKKSYFGRTDNYCRYCGAKMDLEE